MTAPHHTFTGQYTTLQLQYITVPYRYIVNLTEPYPTVQNKYIMLQQKTKLRSTTQTPYNTLPDCSKLCSYFTLPNLAKQLLHSIVLYHYITAQYSTAQNNYFIIIYNTALHQTTTSQDRTVLGSTYTLLFTEHLSSCIEPYLTPMALHNTTLYLYTTKYSHYKTGLYTTPPLLYNMAQYHTAHLLNNASPRSTLQLPYPTLRHRTVPLHNYT